MKGEKSSHRIAYCLLLIAGMLLLPVSARANEPHLLSDKANIYLLTCSPGEALYERFGHTALMVVDEELGIQEVYNYGIFDFNSSHFYWRFVRGETYYQLAKEDASYFIRSYLYYGRQVNIQQLHLSAEGKDAIYRALIVNNYPENRVYLYNFVFDNCATRPYYLIVNAINKDSVEHVGLPGTCGDESSAHPEYTTFRQIIQYYTPRGSWANLGINLLFGPKADRRMTSEQRLFLPEELMMYISQARYTDGTPLVEDEQVQPFAIERVPWYKTWYFGIAVLFILLTALSYYDRRRGKRSRWADYILYGVYAMLLLLVTFLTFFSIHPLVGFGPYLLIIPSIHLCARIIYLWR